MPLQRLTAAHLLSPHLLAAASQQLFNCVCGEDVDDASPFKIIPLEEIKQDFFNRAAVSDFHPIKAQMQVSTPLVLEGGVPFLTGATRASHAGLIALSSFPAGLRRRGGAAGVRPRL